jgi:hypothetical protein
MVDNQNFRLPTAPNFYAGPPRPFVSPFTRQPPPATPYVGSIPDPRFPQWASKMSDGRLVTDYRPKCARNIPTGTQFATRQWMQHNADSIVHASRQRQTQRTGAGTAFDMSVVPKAAAVVKCTPFSCGVIPGSRDGIGMEREEGCPDLFGTFAESRLTAAPQPAKYTQRYEGGRNTPRGGDGWAYEMIGEMK